MVFVFFFSFDSLWMQRIEINMVLEKLVEIKVMMFMLSMCRWMLRFYGEYIIFGFLKKREEGGIIGDQVCFNLKG